MYVFCKTGDYPIDSPQFGQVCCCFILLPWSFCWSWMITRATFFKNYSTCRTVKYFLPLVDPFLYTVPENKLPVNKFHALGSDFDWERLAQSASPNLFKTDLSSIFKTEMLLSFPSEVTVLFSTVQPIWIHLSARCSWFPSVYSLSVCSIDKGNKAWEELRSGFISVLFFHSCTLKFYSVESSVGKYCISSYIKYSIEQEQHNSDSEHELSS